MMQSRRAESFGRVVGKFRMLMRCFAGLVPALFLGCTLPILLTVSASRLSAQVSSKLLRVTVTDPWGRVVIGLERKDFEVSENGVRSDTTGFSSAGSPTTVVVVSEAPMPELGAAIRPEDELIQTRSFPDALRQLSASKSPRKVILTTITPGSEAVPSGIQVLQANPANPSDVVAELDELHNQYVLWVEPSTPPANIKVVLKQSRNLPPLRLTWK